VRSGLATGWLRHETAQGDRLGRGRHRNEQRDSGDPGSDQTP
jgi:hypothetical protein